MNNQCRTCIHKNVCVYKDHYEDANELYKKAKEECEKYPWFICEIKCTQYLSDVGKKPVERTLGGNE